MGTGAETRGQTQERNGSESVDGNEGSNGDGDGRGGGSGNEDKNGNENGEEKRGGGELRYPANHETAGMEDQALPFCVQHYLSRQGVAPVGSQQILAQDPAPARRCGTEGKPGHKRREGENGDEKRDVGGDGNKDQYGNEHEGSDRGENGTENGDENGDEGGKKRERKSL